MQPTTEQQHIIELIPTRANIAIQARAGAGKTSTLKLIAESYPEKTFCAIYFNKANVEELNNSGSKPDNLIGTTIHSAAYKAIMLGCFVKKLSPFLDFNDIRQDDLDELCTCIGVPKSNWKKMSIRFTKVILEVIKEFCKSDAYTISEVASVVLPDLLDNELEGCEDKLVKVIRNHWIYITDSNMAKITHDVYLKMFQLRKLQLTEVWDSVAKCNRRVDVLMLDECLTAKQYVKTSKGLWSIKRLYDACELGQELPEILSYNIEQGLYEYKPMLSALKSENREVFTVKTEGLNKLECTGNHKILTTRGYVPAADLIVGQDVLLLDTVTNQKTKYLLGEEQYQILLGSILGDGSLAKQSKFNTFRLNFTHGEEQLDYLKSKSQVFNCPEPYVSISGYTGKETIWNATTPTFILPYGYSFKDMDARALAIWYMDDGSLQHGNLCTIHSNSFSLEKHIELQQVLYDNFGIIARIAKNREFYYLSFNAEESKKLLELTAPYFHKDLSYKNPYAGATSYEWCNDYKPYGGNIVSSLVVTDVTTVYDIEVADNHNFITCRVASNDRNVSGIIVHNCQDSNPVTLGIIANQNVQKIIVGDSAQSIYGWRGAVGTMEVFDSWQQAALTTSFRFTQDIANMANIVLQRRGEDNLLIGAGSPNPKEGAVILCRKNSTLWKLAFERATAGLYSYVEANFKELKDDLYHISAVMSGNFPQYPSKNLAMYKTKEDLIKAAKIHDELAILIKLGNQMRNFGNGLSDSIKTLQRYLITEKNPEVLCLSTIHKSKGLQWNHVTLADDFLALPEDIWEEDCNISELLEEVWDNPEQTSLLYVAITRAKETVVLPHYLANYF